MAKRILAAGRTTKGKVDPVLTKQLGRMQQVIERFVAEGMTRMDAYRATADYFEHMENVKTARRAA